MARGRRLDTDEIRSFVSAEAEAAIAYMDSDIAGERADALKYYRGDLFGNEVDGRSQVVMSDLQDTVEWMMPSLMRIFLASDQAVRFEPVGPEDEQAADQKTDYCNHIWMKDNEGFLNYYTWFKDALLQKTGIIKIWWDEFDKTARETLSGLTEDELAFILSQEEDIEIVEQNFYPGPVGMLYDVVLERTTPDGRVRIEPIPPEEFLVDRDARNDSDGTFMGHVMRKTVSEWAEMGFDWDQLVSLSDVGASPRLTNQEALARRTQEYQQPRGGAVDEASREVIGIECYVRLDVDGDGYAEHVQVYIGGDSHEIMTRDGEPAIERVDDERPFVSLSPILMPHQFFGRSMYDLIGDLQKIRSTVLRQLLDNMYQVNNSRMAVDETGVVDMDEWLDNRVGGVARTNRPPHDVYAPIVTQPLGPWCYPLLEYLETVGEKRTGITRYNQGLDAETLNDTATGLSRIMAAANQRIELIARTFAETGVRMAFKKILRLVINHQDKERQVRISNEWVPMDPRSWTADIDLTVEVGLGYDSREQELMAAQGVLQLQERILQFQGGAEGPLVTLKNIHNASKKYVRAAGLLEPDKYISDPESQNMQQMMAQKAQQPPQIPPEIQLKQLEIELDRQQGERSAQFDQMKLNAETELKLAEIASRERIERAKLGQKVEEMDVDEAIEYAKLNQQDDEAELAARVNMAQIQAQAAQRQKGETDAEV